MSDLYNLSDDELLNTDLEQMTDTEVEADNVKETSTDVQEAVQEPTEPVEAPEEVQGTDVPNEQEEADTEPAQDTDNSTVDYEAFYQEMTKPFKANGREVSITNANDAIRLMQMGVNYSKKMEQLKPKQALLKALEDNQLDNKEQLGYLIDLANKKPEAIAKLIKEANIDLYDFDVEQADGYVPQANIQETTVFEDTLQELLTSNSGMYDVVNHMGNWDTESKNVLFNEPNLLRVLSEQKANGQYDKIVGIIENERLFGRLTNMPYLQAYATVEQQLNQQQEQDNSFIAPRPSSTNKPDDNLDKKKKAGLPNGNSAQSNEQQFNPLAVSDEELLQLMANT